MPRNAGLMYSGLLYDVRDLLLALPQRLDDATACRIGECLKDVQMHVYAYTH